MSDVKRYAFQIHRRPYGLEEVGSGNLVMHSDYAKLEAEAQALREEVARLHSTMIAAAEEIHEHWDAHCDEEGYGPSNLMYRLEKCIDADYPGYTAGAFARLEQEVAALRARVVVVPNGWGIERVHPEDGIGFIIRSPRQHGVGSGTAVWSDSENPAEQLLALMLNEVVHEAS